MRLRERVGDERLGAAKALGEHDEPHATQQVERALLGVDTKGDHAAKAASLLEAEVVAGMVGKARVEHVAHLRLLLEPRRKRQGVLLVALHAHGQRLDAAAHEPGRERVKPRADRLDEVTQPLGDLGHGRDEQARDDVVVAGEVLGGAVDHHVGAKRDGVHEEGREEGVVHHEQGARAVGQLGQGADVGDCHERVGGTLHEERLGARLESGRDRVEVRRVNAVDLHAVFDTYRVEQANRATIEVPRGHEPVARREELHETGDGGHAG